MLFKLKPGRNYFKGAERVLPGTVVDLDPAQAKNFGDSFEPFSPMTPTDLRKQADDIEQAEAAARKVVEAERARQLTAEKAKAEAEAAAAKK